MSVYEKKATGSLMSYMLAEQHLYGSSRLGMRNPNLEMIGAIANADTAKMYLGIKNYELSNHLGNVLTVISDKKIQMDVNNDNVVDYYVADIISASDYYPFGSVTPGRSFSSGSYRYGFNGQEKDDEVAGSGNSNSAEYWQYDTRLGRRWNLDPVDYTFISPYASFNNSPVFVKDPTGATGEPNQKTGELKTVVYLKQGDGVSDKEFKELVDNFAKNVSSIFEGMKYTNSDGKEVTAHVVVDVRIVTEKPSKLGKGENYFAVETSGISHVDANMTTGMLNINDRNNAQVIAHEWGHLFGLQDRYHLLFEYDSKHKLDLRDETRKTVPMIMSLDFDKEYNPYNNLYSAGQNITSFQKDVLFGNAKENPYTQLIILIRHGDQPQFDAAEVSTKNHKLNVQMFSKGAPAKGYAPAWATSSKFSNTVPFNCSGSAKIHSTDAKKTIRDYFKKH